MLTNDLKALKNVIFAFLSFMDPPIKCPKWLVPHARKNSIPPVFTNGFPLAKIPPVLYAGIYSEKKREKNVLKEFLTLNCRKICDLIFFDSRNNPSLQLLTII